MKEMNIFICLCFSILQTCLASLKPSYTSDWYTIKSVAGLESEVKIYHNLNILPVKVATEVRVVNTQMGEYIIFPGMGSANTDDDYYTKYGGVLVLYNETTVRLIVPGNSGTGSIYGKVIYTGNEGWSGPSNVDTSYTIGEVRVQIWTAADLPIADFETPWQPISVDDSVTFKEVAHGLSGYPSLAVVQINVSNNIFEGQGSSSRLIADYWVETGGVIYGFSDTHFRLWYPAYTTGNPYLSMLSVADGWGYGTYINIPVGAFRILAWKFPDSWIETTDVSVDSITENMYQIQHSSKDFQLMNVEVEAIDGDNVGFRFYGVGSVVNDGLTDSGQYGGLVYGHNENTYNFWLPKNTSVIVSEGHLLNIGGFWGSSAPSHVQRSDNAVIRINTFTLYRDTNYKLVPENSGFAPKDDIVWTMNSQSIQTCANTCLTSLECQSFFYHHGDKFCHGYRYRTFNNTLSNTYPGILHFSR